MKELKKKLIRDTRYQIGIEDCLTAPKVLVALTNYCNMACLYCSTKDVKNKPINMDVGLAKSIIDQTFEQKWGLGFGQTYEPFLHPKIDEIILHVLEKDRIFSSASNGLAIRRSVYDLPMNLLLSFSADKNDFKYRNLRMDFGAYQDKITNFLRHRITHRIPGTISVQIADYSIFKGDLTYDKRIKDIKGIYEKSLQLLSLLEITDFQDMENWETLIANRAPLVLFNKDKTVIQIQPAKIMPNSFEAFAPLDKPMKRIGYCDSCYTMMSIQADGRVAFCCCDPTAKAIAGTIDSKSDLKRFWLGDKMNKVRKGFKAFTPVHAFCTQCLENVSENTKPLLTVKNPKLVAEILTDFGVATDLPWFKFPIAPRSGLLI